RRPLTMPRVASGRGSAAKSASAAHSRSRPKTCGGFPRPLGIVMKYTSLDYSSLKYVQLIMRRAGRQGAGAKRGREARGRSPGGRDASDPGHWTAGAKAEWHGRGDGLGAVGRAELAEKMGDVLLHGVEGDDEL